MSKNDQHPALEAGLQVRYRTGLLLAEEGIKLLEAIAAQGSITRAAQAAGISYRTAWERIEALNNLSDHALVERAVGGRGGGGTRLTEYGAQLVQVFRELEQEHRRFLAGLARRIHGLETMMPMLERLHLQTSARNQLWGQISAIRHGAVNAEVELNLGQGQSITAIITEESLTRLDLVQGSNAAALIKSSSIVITTDAKLNLSARNRLCGRIARVHRGAVNSDVVIELGQNKSIAAVITNASTDRLQLQAGMPACAIFDASSVIIGLSD
ncbi:MAG: TOBE domain-containing protein [Nitrococcus mobilis]|nr:TOBE domain-containing protein [Nitrococcus mobilis]